MLDFGKYDQLCRAGPLTVCPLVGKGNFGIDPICYARAFSIGSTVVFEAATLAVYIIALLMTIFMILSIKSKYTAVGRKEVLLFFYLYALITILSFFLQSGIIPTYHAVYKWFAAAHVGLITAACWCLFLNGFVGYQFIEDGTAFSLWSIRLSSLAVFLASGVIGLATFNSWGFFAPDKTMGLYVVHLVINGVLLLIYFITQCILVFRNLDDLWPLGNMILSLLFFAAGQVILLQFSSMICELMKHYFDGLFFESILTLLAVMMIYKFWDSITKEDLEFSIGGKLNVWEVKEVEDGYYH